MLAKLEGPGYPESLEYLREWFEELWAMSEIGAYGRKPFTPLLIESWARLFVRDPDPEEAWALVQLSHTRLNPPPEPEEE